MAGFRVLGVALLALAASSTVSAPASAQPLDDAVAQVVVDDPVGDVRLQSAGGSGSVVPGYEHVDLVATWIGPETADAVEMGVQVVQWPTAATAGGSAQLSVEFLYGNQLYRASNIGNTRCSAQEAPNVLERPVADEFMPGATEWAFVGCLKGAVDVQESTFKMTVPKALIKDSAGLPIRYGKEVVAFIGNASATTTPANTGGSASARVVDRAPDAAWGPPFPVRANFRGNGTVQAVVQPHSSYATGDAPHLVWIEVDHLGAQPDLIYISSNFPEAGKPRASHPAKTEVPGHVSAVLPVVVNAGSEHVHGAKRAVPVTVRAAGDPTSMVELPVAVRWPEIPVPTQHHAVLYLHSRAVDDVTEIQSVWMNAIRADPRPGSDDVPVDDPSTSVSPGLEAFARWQFPLDPVLRGGLAFDASRPVHFSADFETAVATSAARAELVLSHCQAREVLITGPGQDVVLQCDPDQTTIVATGASEAQAMEAATPTTFEFSADLAAGTATFAPRYPQLLVADILMYSADDAAIESMTIHTADAQMELPLGVYEDPRIQGLNAMGDVWLVAMEPTEFELNPGDTGVVPFAIRNVGQSDVELSLSVQQSGQEPWGRWHAQRAVSVAAGSVTNATLVVRAPATGQHGDVGLMFASAALAADPDSARAVSIVVTINTKKDLPSEENQLSRLEGGGSSTVGALATIALLAAVLASRRRRA